MRQHVVRGGAGLVALLLCVPGTVFAHAFGQRYDLPVPLGYFVVGAALTVALSFVVAALFMRGSTGKQYAHAVIVPLGAVLPALRAISRLLGVLLLFAVLAAGLLGVPNPQLNLAPVLVWIVWWVGLSFLTACVGNIWPVFDPWRTLFEWGDTTVRRLGRSNGICLGLRFPARLDAWPAVFLLLLFVWIEVIYPRAVDPPLLAGLVLAWSTVSMLGMVCFGGDAWRRHADVFTLYFSMIGRFAAITSGPDARTIVLRPIGAGLIESTAESLAVVVFVLAMLATVLFDGLLGTPALALVHVALTAVVPGFMDDRGYILGAAGLICVCLLFVGAYFLACLATSRLVRDRPVAVVARMYALTLVPIAIAYNIAHYFSYLVVQGQLIIPRLSDPLGRQWDLFGTAMYYPDIGLLDARFTWYLAIASIVTGHVISIWLAHRVALREFRKSRQAVIASIPLTVLMMIYTAISLMVMAEPLVQFMRPAAPS